MRPEPAAMDAPVKVLVVSTKVLACIREPPRHGRHDVSSSSCFFMCRRFPADKLKMQKHSSDIRSPPTAIEAALVLLPAHPVTADHFTRRRGRRLEDTNCSSACFFFMPC